MNEMDKSLAGAVAQQRGGLMGGIASGLTNQIVQHLRCECHDCTQARFKMWGTFGSSRNS